jgi:hypothetical protein
VESNKMMRLFSERGGNCKQEEGGMISVYETDEKIWGNTQEFEHLLYVATNQELSTNNKTKEK